MGDWLGGQSSGALSRDEFYEAVGRAMRRGDKSVNPEVAEAAGVMREKVFDPLKEAAIKAGLLPPDVTTDTALSYLTRVYNQPKIAAQRPQFERILTDWLAGSRDEAILRRGDAQTKLGGITGKQERLLPIWLSSKPIWQLGKVRTPATVSPERKSGAQKAVAQLQAEAENSARRLTSMSLPGSKMLICRTSRDRHRYPAAPPG
jgi:hypothetical protein